MSPRDDRAQEAIGPEGDIAELRAREAVVDADGK